MKMLLSALVLVLAADSTLAQPPQPSLEGRTILAVRVSGLDHVKESVVLPQMESVPGQPYLKATADRDIIRLDRLGVFAAIALTPAVVDDGVRVDVTVTETSRMAGGIALTVTDENGASVGPAVKMTRLVRTREIPRSLLAFFATNTRRASYLYSIADHGPHHYLSALRPSGRVTEFGDRH
jgi:hypothetical protein